MGEQLEVDARLGGLGTRTRGSRPLVFVGRGVCEETLDLRPRRPGSLADQGSLGLPDDVRVVVVTKDAAEESVRSLRELAAPDLAVVMSNDAWEHYTVPGSPYFVLVDGPQARVVGEGTGQSWQQVQSLLTHAASDEDEVRRPFNGAAATEARIDRELLVHGIRPGDPRLYLTADELDRTR